MSLYNCSEIQCKFYDMQMVHSLTEKWDWKNQIDIKVFMYHFSFKYYM